MTKYAHTLGDKMLVDEASDDDMSYESVHLLLKLVGFIF